MPALRALRVGLVVASLVVVTGACTSNPKEKASSKGSVDTPVFTGPESAEPSTATTALSLSAVMPAPDGLGPALPFGMQAARAMNGLTQALGRAETVTPVPEGTSCGATRIFRWKDFEVLINEVTARSGGNPGLVGWAMGAAAPAPLGMKTDKGIGIGSTLAAVKAAYGAVTVAQGPNGPTFVVRLANGVMSGDLSGPGDAARVKTLRAGVSCAA
jgi:hypothetical protein